MTRTVRVHKIISFKGFSDKALGKIKMLSLYALLPFLVFLFLFFYLNGRFENILEKKFPKVYKELGLEKLHNRPPEARLSKFGFLIKMKHKELNDPDLTKCCIWIYIIFLANFLYSLFFFSYGK